MKVETRCQVCGKTFMTYLHLLKRGQMKSCSKECGNELVRYSKLGKQNPMWKGDTVSQTALHAWVKRHKPKPEFCEKCSIKQPIDLANISQEYRRDISDFQWLCRKCHMLSDGRMHNLTHNEDFRSDCDHCNGETLEKAELPFKGLRFVRRFTNYPNGADFTKWNNYH